MTLPHTITLNSLENTRHFARLLIQNMPRPSIIGLIGSLGVGKTTLTRFMLEALGNTQPMSSPTFVWLKTYGLSGQHFKRLHHIDAYRLTKLDPELASVIADCQRDSQAITIIEWADRVRSQLVPGSTLLHFTLDIQKNRQLKISRII